MLASIKLNNFALAAFKSGYLGLLKNLKMFSSKIVLHAFKEVIKCHFNKQFFSIIYMVAGFISLRKFMTPT